MSLQENEGKYSTDFTKDNQRFDIEIGDSKQPDFHPQVKLMRWNNEANFSLRLLGFGVANPGNPASRLNDVVSWQGQDCIAKFYQHLDDSGFEFEINFTAQPLTRQIRFSILSKGLDFKFQPELTQLEIDDGAKRPDNIINSYAVFHSNKQNNNYGTGKAFHLYRPWIEDSVLGRVWCDLDITGAVLTIDIPQDFYDNADWSNVTLDPTLGYTTIGGTGVRTTVLRCHRLGAMSENGDLDNINVYIESFNSSSREGRLGFYDESTSKPNALLASTARFTDSTNNPGWRQDTLSATLVSGSTYYIATFAENTISDIFYDTDSNYSMRENTGASFSTLPDPFNQDSTFASRRVSAYINYTASGGSTALLVDDLTQSQSIDQPVLTQAHILTVNDITQNQTIDNIILSVASALLVDDLTQSQTVDLANIIQSHILSVNGLNQAQSVDQPSLSIGITVDDLNQAQNLDVASLNQANILSVDNLTQAQLLDNVYSGAIVVGSHKGEVLVFSAYNGIITSTNAHTGEVKVFNAVDIT